MSFGGAVTFSTCHLIFVGGFEYVYLISLIFMDNQIELIIQFKEGMQNL